MNHVESFVFLDLETTGIPSLEHNKTTITEISLVAVKRQHLLGCPAGETPRVQHKVTLCLNPRRIIQPAASEVSGLCNDLLEHETHFNEDVFYTLNSFLKTLAKPVCLLAHNGFSFDFPILRRSLERIGKDFPEDLLCADTLFAYCDIEKKAEIEQKVSVDEPDLSLLEDEFKIDFQSQNETTPKKNKADFILSKPSKRRTELSEERMEKNAKRRLTYSEKIGKSLSTIYEKLLNKPPLNCHRAEVDCVLNLEAAVKVAGDFVMWVDGNHCLLSKVDPMKMGVPLK